MTLNAARKMGWLIATAESCTGGMVSTALTDIAGSSDVFDRGFVTYSNQAKQEMLGVSENALMEHGAVSVQVAKEMAQGAISNSSAHLAVSITGISGPGGTDFKPEGRVCFGVAFKGNAATSSTVDFGAKGRLVVRQMARDHALTLLLEATKP